MPAPIRVRAGRLDPASITDIKRALAQGDGENITTEQINNIDEGKDQGHFKMVMGHQQLLIFYQRYQDNTERQ